MAGRLRVTNEIKISTYFNLFCRENLYFLLNEYFYTVESLYGKYFNNGRDLCKCSEKART